MKKLSVAFQMLMSTVIISMTSADKKPNFLIIVATDHPVNAISAYGPSNIQTPRIDSLAAEGIRYNNALVTNALPAPSNAAMMTGKYCSNKDNTVCVTDDVDYYDEDGDTWTFVKELKEKAGY